MRWRGAIVPVGLALLFGCVRSAPAFDASQLSLLVIAARAVPAAPVEPILIAHPAQSEEVNRPLQKWVVPMYAGFVTLQVLDVDSSIRAVHQGLGEANPLLRWTQSNHAALIATKAATAAATIYFTERLRRRHPKAALAVMIAFNATYTAIVIHNYRVLR